MIAVLSNLISEQFEKCTGIKSLSLQPYASLDLPVSTHADMLLCVIDKSVFCYETYYQENFDLFKQIESAGYSIIRVERECSKRYPRDIALNVLVIDKILFCNKRYVASEILNYAKENCYKIIDVKQGYSACSTMIIDKKNVITADNGMRMALEKEKIKVHFISSEGIKLPGYNCGFIGGSGVVAENKAYFFGSIEKHPDYEKIKNVFDDKKIKIIEIIPDDVCDFGGVKIFWLYILNVNYKQYS